MFLHSTAVSRIFNLFTTPKLTHFFHNQRSVSDCQRTSITLHIRCCLTPSAASLPACLISS